MRHNHSRTTLNLLVLFFTLCALALLQGCSSGSNDTKSTNSGKGTGTVGILLTDAPADPDLFSSINVTIEKIELMGDDEERVTLFDGPADTFDLLRLRHESIPFSFTDGVPVGEYCKVRLTLAQDGLELIFADAGADPEYPKLPGNRKLDLNIRDCIEVEDGATLALQLDIDARRSIHVIGNNNGYQFRPVVFVDAVEDDFVARLVRLEGKIAAYDENSQQILLCHALPTMDADSAGCVLVSLDEHSALFDNITEAGAPQVLESLFNEDQIGQELAIVGWPKRPQLFEDWPEIDLGDLPDLGECIVWDLYAGANEQELSIDCDFIPEELDDHLVVVDHEGINGKRHWPRLRVDALVLKQGVFASLEGKPANDADMNGFELELPPEPTINRNPLPVVLQAGDETRNGTRIVTKQGQLLDYTAIRQGMHAEVDGVIMTEELQNMWLNAALVILDGEPELLDQAVGVVSDVTEDQIVLTLEDVSLCGQTVNTLNVTLNDDVQVVTVTITDSSSEVSLGGTPSLGQEAGVSGECDDTLFEAHSLVLVDDQRSPL